LPLLPKKPVTMRRISSDRDAALAQQNEDCA
jgi:hypothetical protein